MTKPEVPGVPAAKPEEPPARTVGARRRAGALALAARSTVWGLVLALGAVVAILSETHTGQRLALEQLLRVARARLAGNLTVEDVRSRTLFTGMTLVGVSLDAADGRPVLAADSIVMRYTPLSLLAGSPRVHSTTLYALRLELSRSVEDGTLNVSHVLARQEPDSAPPAVSAALGLGRISVRGGAVEVLTGERHVAVDIEDLDLEETVLRPGGAVVFDARLASLSAAVHLLEDPVVIREAAGNLAFGPRGLELSEAALRLPGTLLSVEVRFGPERAGSPWILAAELGAEGWGDLADLQWLDERVPPGRFRGGARVRAAADGVELELRAVELELEASRLRADGSARLGEALGLRDLRLTAMPFALPRLASWLGRDLPYDGFLSGEVTLSGTLEALDATGRLTLVPVGFGGVATTADFSGTLHLGADPGASDLDLRLDPLNWRLLERFWAGARELGGGTAALEVNGRAAEGLQVVARLELAPGPDAASPSRWAGRGVFTRRADADWVLDVSGDLSPFDLDVLDRIWPESGLQGEVTGSVHASGTLARLDVGGELAAGGALLSFTGLLDRTAPKMAYRLAAEAEGWPLSEVLAAVPAPSELSASVAVEGRGATLDALAGEARITLRPSRIGAVRLEGGVASLRAEEGLLFADTLDAHGSGVHVSGRGALGLVAGSYGEARVEVQIESLLELRPVLMGDSIIVRDGLTPLEQDLLRVRGIEPDTLPSELDVRMAGSVAAVAALRGSIRDFELELDLEALSAAYRHDSVDSLRLSVTAGGLPATAGDWAVLGRARGVTWNDRSFEEIELGGTMSGRRGEGTLDVRRRRNERYYAAGVFALDSAGGYVELADASAQINDLSWILSHPTRIAWTGSSVSVDSLEIARLGDDPMRLVAAGTLARGGDSAFRLELEGFHVEDALQVMQREDLDAAGHVDLSLTVLGPSESPMIHALFQIDEPRFGTMALSRVGGSLEYRDRSSTFRVDGWSAERNVLRAEGVLPYDLALTDVAERSVDEAIDVRVAADGLEARVALAPLEALRDVDGTLSADFHIGGTTQAPQPSGIVRLADGAWTIEALGVRHQGVTGEVLLRPDRTLSLSLATTRSGTSTVAGTVTLEPLQDPALDLIIGFDRFLAVDRRDMVSRISGEFRLGGTYRLPVAQGSLRVDEGILFVDEFARAAGVVDLTDPLLFADGFAVDTTVFVSQPLLAGIRNPFLDNLRVDIGMSVPRNMWLRSDAMNVEMGGELLVRYDRALGDLVLVGELQALRGSYLVLGRTFEVTGGTVAFLGQPGVNPALDIQARSRIRRRGGDPLEVLATVEGTLVQPLVTLSSEEAGLAQSDLVSYLVFGRASAELATGEATGPGGAFGQNLGGAAGTLAVGALANRFGAALAQEIGLDYVAITQGEIFGEQGAARNFLATAQVELGRYVTDDVFLVLVLARGTQGGEEGPSVNPLRGVRVEWALTDEIFVEGFIEDRFLRSGTGGLGVAGLDGVQILGAFVFGEWGYGSDD